MEKAIKRAIKGGWKPKASVFKNSKTKKHILETFKFCYPDAESIRQHRHFYQYLLDPLFWKALGKAEKWDEDSGVVFNHRFLDEKEYAFLVPARFYPTQNSWQYHMHCFVDHIADEKDIDGFFNQLIKGE